MMRPLISIYSLLVVGLVLSMGMEKHSNLEDLGQEKLYSADELGYVHLKGSAVAEVNRFNDLITEVAKAELNGKVMDLSLGEDAFNSIVSFLNSQYFLDEQSAERLEFLMKDRPNGQDHKFNLKYNGLIVGKERNLRGYVLELISHDGSSKGMYISPGRLLNDLGFEKPRKGEFLPLGASSFPTGKYQGLKAVIRDYTYLTSLHHHFKLQHLIGSEVDFEVDIESIMETVFYFKKGFKG